MQQTATRILAPLLILIAIGMAASIVHVLPEGRSLSFSLLSGAAFGVVLQRSRFCFLCNFRDFADNRDGSGLLAIIVALAAGTVLYMAVTMAWVPVPQEGRLPPNAHIGPVGPALAVAALVFGIGMAISGSCLSAHLYRLGEGSPTSPFALAGAGLGFFIGFLTWNPIYLAFVSENSATWLPHTLGYAGTTVLSLALLALIALFVLTFSTSGNQKPSGSGLADAARRIFVDRWPPIIAGLLVAAISAIAFLRVAPLGVTAELGSLARTVGSGAGALPETLLGLDGLRGCATVVKQTLISRNGLFVTGIVAASFASAVAAGQFRPRVPTVNEAARGIVGGILMGWGAMTGLGCTVGVLLSGIHAGALSGWVFLGFCTLGVWGGLFAMRRLART